MQDTEVDRSSHIELGGTSIAIGDSSGAKKALPAGTTRQTFEHYEEFIVPPATPAELLPNERLVDISALDDWAQSAFAGFTSLNRIQSRIFQVGALKALT
jgi:activating signal cointegrator complex subunit 3